MIKQLHKPWLIIGLVALVANLVLVPIVAAQEQQQIAAQTSDLEKILDSADKVIVDVFGGAQQLGFCPTPEFASIWNGVTGAIRILGAINTVVTAVGVLGTLAGGVGILNVLGAGIALFSLASATLAILSGFLDIVYNFFVPVPVEDRIRIPNMLTLIGAVFNLFAPQTWLNALYVRLTDSVIGRLLGSLRNTLVGEVPGFLTAPQADAVFGIGIVDAVFDAFTSFCKMSPSSNALVREPVRIVGIEPSDPPAAEPVPTEEAPTSPSSPLESEPVEVTPSPEPEVVAVPDIVSTPTPNEPIAGPTIVPLEPVEIPAEIDGVIDDFDVFDDEVPLCIPDESTLPLIEATAQP
jgi:hypothetical protein